MNRRLTSALAIILSVVMLLCAMPVSVAFAEEGGTEINYGHRASGHVAGILNVPHNNRGTLPESYDGRDSGHQYTEVKNQGSYGSCWAHAFTAAVETFMMENGLADSSVNLSELQLATATYGKAYDEMGLLGNDYATVQSGFNALSIGGNHTGAAMTMNRWNAITDENVMHYANDAKYTITDGMVYSDDYYCGLNDAYLYKYITINSESVDEVKANIMQYGIGITSYYADDNYLNTATGAYYSNRYTDTNHEITVIGWDDNYSASNFKEGKQPTRDGAWLVRNSWGSTFGNNGYIWISYADTSLDSEFAFVEVVSSDEWDHNYQYDGGYSLSATTAQGGIANIYTATGSQLLKAVSVSMLRVLSATYTVRVYKNPTSATSFVVTDTPVYTGTYTTTYNGIYTAELTTPVALSAGDTFAVVITITSAAGNNIYYDYSTTSNWGWMYMNEDASNARCYSISRAGSSTKYSNGVFRIKAFTVDADLATPDNLTATLNGNTVTLAWNAVEGATAYEIYGGTDLSDYALITETTTNGATLTTSDANGLLLKYKVRAKNDDVTGNFCDAEAVKYISRKMITGLTLADTEVLINSTVNASATILPVTANDKFVGYSVADTSVATVTPDGRITGVSTGTTTIKGITRNGLTATATVTVTDGHECAGADPVRENETAATCTAKGSYDSVIKCSICGKELSRTPVETEMTEHTAAAPVRENETAATCTVKGSYDSVIKCSVCKVELSRTPVETETVAHTAGTPVKENETEANCSTEGGYDTVTYCTECGATISTTHTKIDAVGHVDGEEKIENEVAATCTTKGGYDTVLYCKVCGEVISTNHTEIGTLNHVLYVSKAEVAATHTAKGSTEEISCKTCGAVIYPATETPEIVEHTAGTAVKENEIAPACTTDGGYDTVTYCTLCGEEMLRLHTTLTKTGHTIVCTKASQAATCVEDGWTNEYSCTVCGEIVNESTAIPATGRHIPDTAVKENETSSTCTTAGTYDSVVYCTVCKGEISKTQVEKDLLAHSPVTSIAAVAATCTTAGNTAETSCRVCGAIITKAKEIPALGHDLTGYKGLAPTCTEKGYNGYTACKRCDYTTKTEIPALGHDLVTTEGIPATCTTTGFETYVSCSRCDYTTYKQTPKTAHDYADGTCTMCGKTQPGASETCTHMCHKSGFMGFIWKIINLFNKMFKSNQTCPCGAAHW